MTLPDNPGRGAPGPPRKRHQAPGTRAALAVAAALVLVAGACGGGSARNPFDADKGVAATQIRIRVENRNFSDVRIYAVANSGEHPLGVVGGNQTETFRLDWRQLATLYFRLDFLAGQSVNTHSVNVSPGNQVEMEIPATPTNIILRVR